ncbi:MAG: molybdopterin-dependent oxidoreductase [Pseudomonadota bacterium]
MALANRAAGLAVAAVVAAFSAHPASATETCQVVLTVFGEISNSNRGPIDPFDDVLIYNLGADFEAAYGFCQDDLTALPQVTITADYNNFDDGPVTATGPTLASVLEAAGASSSLNDVVLTAFDGYQYVVQAGADMSQVLAAIEADGAVLDFGGRGPVWIFAEPGVINDASGELDEGLVWALVMVEVE